MIGWSNYLRPHLIALLTSAILVVWCLPAFADQPPVSPTDFAVLVSNDLPLSTPAAIPALSPWGTGVFIIVVALLLGYFTWRQTRGAARIAMLSLLLVFASIAVVRADSVTTLLGNVVVHFHRPRASERDFTASEKAVVAQIIAAQVPSAVKLSDATIAFNAHGKNFDNSGAWINNDQIQRILDDGYATVAGPAVVGDLLVYRNNGSITYTATATAVDAGGTPTEAQGKWGSAGEYSHGPGNVPASYGGASVFRQLLPFIEADLGLRFLFSPEFIALRTRQLGLPLGPGHADKILILYLPEAADTARDLPTNDCVIEFGVEDNQARLPLHSWFASNIHPLSSDIVSNILIDGVPAISRDGIGELSSTPFTLAFLPYQSLIVSLSMETSNDLNQAIACRERFQQLLRSLRLGA